MGKRKATPIQHHEIVQRFASRLRELRRTRGMTQKELEAVLEKAASITAIETAKPKLGNEGEL